MYVLCENLTPIDFETVDEQSYPFVSKPCILVNEKEIIGIGVQTKDSATSPIQWRDLQGNPIEQKVVAWEFATPLRPKLLELLRRQNPEDFLDEDGYPTSKALYFLENWDGLDPEGWFKFAISLWHFKAYAYQSNKGKKVYINLSTAGWSGNETLIRSMKKHSILWSTCFESLEKGGHFVFSYEDEN